MIGFGVIKATIVTNVNITATIIRILFGKEIIMAMKIFRASITKIPKKKLIFIRFIIL